MRTEQNFEAYELPFIIKDVQIIDTRDSTVLTEEMKLPFISKPKQLLVSYPKMSMYHKELINESIRKSFSPSNIQDSVVVFIHVLEGIKQFCSTATSETELANVAIELTLFTSKLRVGSVGEAEMYYTSIDASPKRLEEIYRQAISASLSKALLSIKKQLESLNG